MRLKVYGITEVWAPGGYDPVTVAICSTREKAENMKKRFEVEYTDLMFDIEEWEVDKE